MGQYGSKKSSCGKKARKVKNILPNSPLGRMLDSWEMNEATPYLDRIKIIHFCMEEWPKLDIEWPWFGSEDAWMCTQLKQSLSSQPKPDGDQLVYAACWGKEKSRMKTVKICKLKEHKDEAEGEREEKSKPWDPLDHLPPPLAPEPLSQPQNPLLLPPPPDLTPISLSPPLISLLLPASSSPNSTLPSKISQSQTTSSLSVTLSQVTPPVPQTPLTQTSVLVPSPPSQVPLPSPPPPTTPMLSGVPLTTSVLTASSDPSQASPYQVPVPASPQLPHPLSTPALSPHTPGSLV